MRRTSNASHVTRLCAYPKQRKGLGEKSQWKTRPKKLKLYDARQ